MQHDRCRRHEDGGTCSSHELLCSVKSISSCIPHPMGLITYHKVNHNLVCFKNVPQILRARGPDLFVCENTEYRTVGFNVSNEVRFVFIGLEMQIKTHLKFVFPLILERTRTNDNGTVQFLPCLQLKHYMACFDCLTQSHLISYKDSS